MSDKLIDIHDLREKLAGRSLGAILEDLNTGRLPKPVKMGGRRYWFAEEVDQHLRDLRDRQTGAAQ